MPCSQLPDDLIEEIGGYLLHVPDNEFRWNESSFPSPFSENTESYSSILLVSKSWYYALIPSLYRVVILRSKAQARALERTLRGDITLGPKIKRMRVEGGLGPSMEHIIHLAPDIEELWLHLRVWRDDDASGLLLALPKMKNVKRLILHDPDQPPKENASSRKIVEAICSVIVTWKQLNTIHLPYHEFTTREFIAIDSVCAALEMAPHLSNLVMFLKQHHTKKFLQRFLRNPGLTTLTFIPWPYLLLESNNRRYSDTFDRRSLDGFDFRELHNLDEKHRRLIRVSTEERGLISLDDLPISSNPVRGTPENLQARPLIPHKTSDNFHTFLTQSLSRPRAFHLLRLRDRDYTDLSGTHPYGFLGRTIEMNDLALLAMCGKWSLTVLTGWRIISLPKIKSGINEGGQASTPMILDPWPLFEFQSLRVFEWCSDIQLWVRDSFLVPPGPLPNLEVLIVKSENDSFLRLLCLMKLPALREVSFPLAEKMVGVREFLKVHGWQIKTLKLEAASGLWGLCKNLAVAHLYDPTFNEPHPTLRKIVLTRHLWKRERSSLEKVFQTVDTITDINTSYPSLEEIQVNACSWPTTEREIMMGMKSKWVRWSERIGQWGVKLTDQEGRGWRRRLR